MEMEDVESFDLTAAEWQMIEILRHDQNITLMVTKEGDHWHLRLEHHDSGVVGDGHGTSFTPAWDDIADPRLRPPRLLK